MGIFWVILAIIFVLVVRNFHISVMIAMWLLGAGLFFTFIYPRIKYFLKAALISAVCTEIIWVGIIDWDFRANHGRIYEWLLYHVHVLFLNGAPLHSLISLFPYWNPYFIPLNSQYFTPTVYNPDTVLLFAVIYPIILLLSLPIWKAQEEDRRLEAERMYRQQYQQQYIMPPMQEQKKKIPFGFQLENKPETKKESAKKKEGTT